MKRVVELRFVLDILFQDVEAVDFRREPRGDRGARDVLALGHLARRAGGVGGDDRLELQFADDVAALAERHHVALHRLDGLQASRPSAPSADCGSAGTIRR